MNICVYCSSKSKLDKKFYKMGEQFGKMLADNGHTLVYGGASHGIMSAVARGCATSGGKVIGVIPKIFEKDGWASEYCTTIIHTESMRERKHQFEDTSDAFVILPGGIGTFDELFETVTNMSIKENATKKIIIYNYDGVYDLLEKMLDENVSYGFTSKKDRQLLTFCTSIDEIAAYLK